VRPSLVEEHGERVRLLSRRGSRTPDAESLRSGPRSEVAWQENFPEKIERNLVAEEECLVDGHCLDDRTLEIRVASGPKRGDERAKALEAEAPADRFEAALGQVPLLRGQGETGTRPQKRTQKVELQFGHGSAPAIWFLRAGPISDRGSTPRARPARTMLPGMPQMVLVASS
jgi:hypothetical protein